MKRFFRYALWTVGLGLIVLLLFIGSLFFREQRLPRVLISWLEERLGDERVALRVDSASFGFRHGLRVQGVRVYDRTREDSLESPVVCLRMATLDWFRRRVDLSGLDYSRLPEGYYHPDGTRSHGFDLTLPKLPDLRVTLARSSVLGVNVEKASADVKVGRNRLEVKDLKVRLPDRGNRLEVKGALTLDLATRQLTAQAEGAVLHGQIAPVIRVLDVQEALPYVEAFTQVSGPVRARYALVADLATADVDMSFDLKIPSCCYHRVPMARAEGSLRIQTFHAEDKPPQFAFTLDLPVADDREGRRFSGRLTVDDRSGPTRLGFKVMSSLRFPDFLALIDVFKPEDFATVACERAPEIVLEGTCGTTPEDLEANDLKGSVRLLHGALGGFKVNELEIDLTLRRDVLKTQAKAVGCEGGNMTWSDRTVLTDFDLEKSSFELKGTYRDGTLTEVSDVFAFSEGMKRGRIDADLQLSGCWSTNRLSELRGSGSLKVKDGDISQMGIFRKLMSFLPDRAADGSVVFNRAGHSSAQMTADFTIDGGVLKSENVYMVGDFLFGRNIGLTSLMGTGTYDIAKDSLDFVIGFQLLQDDSILERAVNWVLSPLRKLLMELSLKGSLGDPEWRYIRPWDRLF